MSISRHWIGVSAAAISLALFAAPAIAADEAVEEAAEATTTDSAAVADDSVEEAAEDDAEAAADDGTGETKDEIVVVGARFQGDVETDIPPTDTLDEADVLATGASSVADVLAALGPQTGSGRGRGGGQPVILLNGQRISSFRDIRDLPPEAIKRVQIFPEELALQYGFRPDQRVVNFILKDNFASFNVETEYAVPQKGGYDNKEFETTFTRIGKSSRLNVDIEYESRSRLTEDERDVISSGASAPYALQGNVTGLDVMGVTGPIDPALSALSGQVVTVAAVPGTPTLAGFAANANQEASGDIGEFRTLLGSQQRFEVNSNWSKTLGPQTNISLNAAFEQLDQQSLLGLPFASLTVPGGSAFSPFASTVLLNRYFNSPRPLRRDSETSTASFGAGLNTMVKDWRLALTADYVLVDSESRTFTNADTAALQAAIDAGTVNPFSANLGSDLQFTVPDTTDSVSGGLTLRGTMSGNAFMLPAGPVKMTLSGGLDRKRFDTSSFRRGVVSDVSLKRDRYQGAVNVDVPLFEKGVSAIGALSVNGNIGISDVSGFGSLIEYGAGARWSPAQNLSLSVSVIGDEIAPTLSELGNPLTVTPNVAYFDFARGESRFVELVTGGNPALIGEKRRDFKASIDWSPKFIDGLSMQLEYFRNKSNDTTAAFPLLTPEIELAFPDRVTRDLAGQLVRVDQRPVNFDTERSQRIRWGFNISGALGKQPEGGGAFGGPPGGGGRPPGAGGGRGGGRPPGAGGGGGGGGRGPGGGGGIMPGGGQPSRWNIALSHTIRLQDEILIRPGLPVLDLLNGSATSSLGGSPRHEVVFSGGVFHKGMGFRLEGNYRSATRVDGSTLTGTSDLRFGDLTTLSAFIFINLDQRGDLTKKLKWLKGSRIAIRVDNLLGDVIDVRDNNGVVPLSYQPGLLDPQGRVFEISFRKRF